MRKRRQTARQKQTQPKKQIPKKQEEKKTYIGKPCYSKQGFLVVVILFSIAFLMFINIHMTITFGYSPKLLQLYSPFGIDIGKGVRGAIVEGGKYNLPLAYSIPTYTLWINPHEPSTEGQYLLIAYRLGLISPSASREKKEAIIREVSDIVHGKIPEDMPINVRYTNHKYWWVDDTQERIYPHHTASYTIAAPIIGFTTPDGTGIDGLELTLNDIIRAKYIPYKSFLLRTPDIAVKTTIDLGIQYKAEILLDQIEREIHPMSSWIVVMTPTGAIRAMAIRPTTRLDKNRQPVYNPVISGRFEMGSVLKPLTLMWAMEKIGLKLTDTFDDTGSLKVDKYVIKSVIPAGKHATVLKGLKLSSNVVFAQVALKLGYENYISEARLFGLDKPTGIELPGEISGILPPKGNVYLAVSGFGYGIYITPIELLRAYTPIATGGLLYNPTLIEGIYIGDKYTPAPHRPPKRVISENVANTVRQALTEVVHDSIVRARVFVSGKEIKVAGKTGTAEIAMHGEYSSKQRMFTFIGMFPADKPEYIIMTTVYRPQNLPKGVRFASQVAAPIFREIATFIATREGMLPDK